MEENKEFSTRWRYYIDRPFQNQFMLRFALIIIIVAVVTLGSLWLLQANAYNLLPDSQPVLFSQEYVLCSSGDAGGAECDNMKTYNAFDLYWAPVAVVSIINLILILLFGLFYSHSMAGPIHKIKMSVERIVNGGAPEEIRIRRGDQFQDVVELLNQLINKRVK
ncbi:MAG: hypothetical protein KDK30_05175 [Leptospiraceae bacterium]|nr:hypothetical protein [Leptospiraceae bacterium]MCB1314330.1 hypothetical protein [Leptospiraceae bacterium]MCB1320052.1 hypothetical protein [Leptospiraceae bacterium]